MRENLIINPKFEVYDNEKEICFYNSEEAKGTILRGLGVVLFRHIEKSKERDFLDLEVLRNLFEEELIKDFLDSLSEKSILIDKSLVKPKKEVVLDSITIGILGSNNSVLKFIEIMRELGYKNFILEEKNKLKGLESSLSNINFVSSIHEIEKAKVNIIINIDEFNDIQKTRKLNRISSSKNIPFLNLSIYSSTFQLGPLVLPGQGACFECYWQRLQSTNESTEDWYLNYISKKNISIDEPTAYLNYEIALKFLALECLRFTSIKNMPKTLNHIVFHDTLNNRINTSSLIEIPECIVCKSAGGLN